ncbi:hypothetical protein L208DRAFT_1312657, partial [Tricholoma matsutake]
DVPEFSNKYSAERVAGYMSSCSRLGDGHWTEILEACSFKNQDPCSEDKFADISLLDQQCGNLFAFCSPLKG